MTVIPETHYFESDPAKAKIYVLAGKAIFTVTNTKTGGKFTFKVVRKKQKGAPRYESAASKLKREAANAAQKWRVYALYPGGSVSNWEDFGYIGSIIPPKSGTGQYHRFFWSGEWNNRQNKLPPMMGAPDNAKAFKWTAERIVRENLPAYIRLNHYGTCGRCNKQLTDEENFALQEEFGWLFGPTCRKRLGLPSTAKQAKATKKAKAAPKKTVKALTDAKYPVTPHFVGAPVLFPSFSKEANDALLKAAEQELFGYMMIERLLIDMGVA